MGRGGAFRVVCTNCPTPLQPPSQLPALEGLWLDSHCQGGCKIGGITNSRKPARRNMRAEAGGEADG